MVYKALAQGATIGIGVASHADKGDLIEALQILPDVDLTIIATRKGKETHPVLIYAQEVLGLPIVLFDVKHLEEMTPRLKNPSDSVFHAIGCHGVAEASALAACGHDGELIVEKTKFGGVTVAIAKSFSQ
ncbi:cobalamin biosynthesis protein [Bartonella sp. LJL80]